MHALLWTPGILALGLILSLAPSKTHAQVVNADYMEIVKRYMARPTLSALMGRGDGTLRVTDFEVPDTLHVGDVGTFALRTNIESASVPFEARWSFGDGGTARGLVARYAYQRPGDYTVHVTIENHRGRVARDRPVVVLPSDAAEAASP